MRMNSFSSSFGQTTMHMCFVTKYRHKVFSFERIKSFCEHMIRKTAAKYDIEVKEIGFDKDHVHMLLGLKPTMSPSEASRLLKGVSSRKIFLAFPWLKNILWGGHLWSPAYFFDSVGDNTFDHLTGYVRNQGNSTRLQAVVI